MGGRYYSDPTADIAMANARREVKRKKEDEVRLRNYIQRLFQRMKNMGMSRKEIIETLRTEYEKFLNKCG